MAAEFANRANIGDYLASHLAPWSGSDVPLDEWAGSVELGGGWPPPNPRHFRVTVQITPDFGTV